MLIYAVSAAFCQTDKAAAGCSYLLMEEKNEYSRNQLRKLIT